MDRSAIEAEITGMLGAVPGWLSGMDDDCLASQWNNVKFVMGDSSLAGRDKALVSFGAAVAAGCLY
jgi:hypothetical protein